MTYASRTFPEGPLQRMLDGLLLKRCALLVLLGVILMTPQKGVAQCKVVGDCRPTPGLFACTAECIQPIESACLCPIEGESCSFSGELKCTDDNGQCQALGGTCDPGTCNCNIDLKGCCQRISGCTEGETIESCRDGLFFGPGCECEPTAIELRSFTAKAQVDGTVILVWKTATEIDNAGFNLYRASATGGPYTQINSTLIPAQGDPVAGASYRFKDSPGLGPFRYILTDVDTSGKITLHGPVRAKVIGE